MITDRTRYRHITQEAVIGVMQEGIGKRTVAYADKTKASRVRSPKAKRVALFVSHRLARLED